MFRLDKPDVALNMVNQIRSRVHMNGLNSVTWNDIVNERRVEMAFEETTYWDLFRWGIAVDKMSGGTNPLKIMKVVAEAGKDNSYTISNLDKYPKRVRTFNNYQYYYPIPWDEIRYHVIEQNPEWTEM